MKRLLAIVLSLALALGLGVSAFAKDDAVKLKSLDAIPAEDMFSIETLLQYLTDGDVSLPQNARNTFDRLLSIEYNDDDSYEDYAAVILLAHLFNEGTVAPDALLDVLAVLIIQDYLDAGYDDLIALDNIIRSLDDVEELTQFLDSLPDLVAPFADGFHDALDSAFIQQLFVELFDNDDYSDVEALLQYLILIGAGGYVSGDLVSVLKTIAIIDALDDDDRADYESILSFIRSLLESYGDAATYDTHKANIEYILGLIENDDYAEADRMIPEMLFSALMDNLNIDDLDLLMRIISIYGTKISGNDLGDLLQALALVDYYDDYDDSDFNRVIEHIRLLDKGKSKGKFNTIADSILHLALILNPDDATVESDPLAK